MASLGNLENFYSLEGGTLMRSKLILYGLGILFGTLIFFGACKKEAPAPTIEQIMPRKVNADEVSILRIQGSGFQVNARVFLDELRSPGVMVEDDKHITLIVPALKEGLVNIKLVNPDGKQVIRERAFRVMSPYAEETILHFQEAAEKMGAIGEIRANDVGAALGDYNNDGWDDILVTGFKNLKLLMNNQEGEFVDVTELAGLGSVPIRHGGIWGDLDNDGDLDLVVAHDLPVIFRNTGNGTFEDVSEKAAIPRLEAAIMPACADYDRDGYLDIFFTGYGNRPNMLMRNQGDWTFSQAFPEIFGEDKFSSPGAAWGDYDNDGFPDLFVANVAEPCRLYHNESGGGFVEVAEKAGVDNQKPDSKPDDRKYYPAYSALWEDFDNDGWLDLVVNNFGQAPAFFRNRADGTFENIGASLGLRDPMNGMGLSAADFNNDGYLDLFLNNITGTFALYLNQAGTRFRKITREAGLDCQDRSSFGSAWADMNHDGAVDFYITNNFSANFLYMNQPYPDQHYLMVRLVGKKSNASAIGARVLVQAGDMKMIREVNGGFGDSSQNSFEVHFGLGKAVRVDRLTIRWPSGIEQEMTDVEADQRLVITESKGSAEQVEEGQEKEGE
jgi:hypothetical protein